MNRSTKENYSFEPAGGHPRMYASALNIFSHFATKTLVNFDALVFYAHVQSVVTLIVVIVWIFARPGTAGYR